MPVGAVSSSHRPMYTATAAPPSRYKRAPNAAQLDAGRSLKLGQRGKTVSDLQNRLNNAGLQPPLTIDGKFGPNTDAAVRAFQTQNNLQVDGQAGPQTLGALRSGATFEPADVTRARTDSRAAVGETDAVRAPEAEGRATPTVNLRSGLSNSAGEANANPSAMEQLLSSNPDMRTNQDFINHCYKKGGGNWAGAAGVAGQYGQDLNQLVQNRSDPIAGAATSSGNATTAGNATNAAAAATAVTNPNATGADVETFPVAGGRYNVGYDRNWDNFDANSAHHNSDYSLNATNASHPSGHLGVDIFAPRGQPVVSPVTGVIEDVGRDTSTGGNTVTVRRGEHRYYMAHLDSLADGLRPGMSVAAGDDLGTVGNSGNARGTAPHVHFSIYEGQGGYRSGTINPYPHLMAGHDQ